MPGKGNLGRLQERGAFEKENPSWESLRLALARWAASGLFQLKPATPASTALAVLPLPAMFPLYLRYPGHLGCFCLGWPFAFAGFGRVSLPLVPILWTSDGYRFD
jgi:hypothetical protein